jgi:hypothetical protein
MKKKKHLSWFERHAKDETSSNNLVKNCNGLEIRIQAVAKTNLNQFKPPITLSVKTQIKSMLRSSRLVTSSHQQCSIIAKPKCHLM